MTPHTAMNTLTSPTINVMNQRRRKRRSTYGGRGCSTVAALTLCCALQLQSSDASSASSASRLPPPRFDAVSTSTESSWISSPQNENAQALEPRWLPPPPPRRDITGAGSAALPAIVPPPPLHRPPALNDSTEAAILQRDDSDPQAQVDTSRSNSPAATAQAPESPASRDLSSVEPTHLDISPTIPAPPKRAATSYSVGSTSNSAPWQSMADSAHHTAPLDHAPPAPTPHHWHQTSRGQEHSSPHLHQQMPGPPRQHYPQPVDQRQQQQLQPWHPPPGTRPSVPRQIQAPVWQSLWRRVERGLDTLADLEHVVATRAQTAYHSAIQAAPIVAQLPRVSRPVRTTARVEQMDLTRFRKVGIPTATLPASTVSTTMRGPVEPSNTGRGIDWNNVERSIRANGGASVPPSAYPSNTVSHPVNPLEPPASSTLPRSPFSVGQAVRTTTAPPSNSTSPFKAYSQAAAIPDPQPASVDATRPVRRYLDDDDEEDSILGKIRRFVPPIPRLGVPSWFRRGSSNDFAAAALDAWRKDDDAGRDDNRGLFGIFSRKRSERNPVVRPALRSEQKEILTTPMMDFMRRLEKGDATSLLSLNEEDQCRSIGRQKAFFDLLVLVCLLATAQTLPVTSDLRLPTSVVEAFTITISNLLSFLAASMETWAPFTLATAYLSSKSRTLLCDGKQSRVSSQAMSVLRDESRYGALFLRLVSSTAVDDSMPDRMQSAVHAQISSKVDVTRLQTFVAGMVLCFLAMTLMSLQPVVTDVLNGFGSVLGERHLMSWPPRSREIVSRLIASFGPVLESGSTLVRSVMYGIRDNPTRFVYKMCLVLSLIAVAYIPTIESHRRVSNADEVMTIERGEREFHSKFTTQISNLGISGASRLSLMAVDGRVDAILERWRAMLPQSSENREIVSLPSIARFVGYIVLSGVLLASPLVMARISSLTAGSSSVLPRWDSVFDVTVVLLYTFQLVWSALTTSICSEDVKVKIGGFVSSFRNAVEERRRLLGAPSPNIQLQASLSPTAGITVHDLWASHVTKRAWAVRGASLTCRNGEVVVLLGENGAGKTRLLTVIAESIVSPTRRALSAQKVRGSISVGGVDVNKWDNRQLKSRLGIALNDVRTVSDTAQVLSGLSLEEILDPCTGIRDLDPTRSPGPNERAAMMLALRITGLSASLLPRLPSKLATVVTANEEDMLPSTIRPRYQILSPAEWSNLLLTRVIAQTVYDNDNSSGSNDNLLNCLVGSILLLDDHLLHLTEVDEARLLFDLRQSGVATIVSSNRWATGRFADRIVVMKDGAVVETGTHAELLNRGPQQSMYAAKWHAITNA